MTRAALRSVLSIAAAYALCAFSAALVGGDNLTALADDQAGIRDAKSRTRIDATAPTARIELHPKPNDQGWNRSDVTVRFVCRDAGGSGLAQCPPRPVEA